MTTHFKIKFQKKGFDTSASEETFRKLNFRRIINKSMVLFMLQKFLGTVGNHGVNVQVPV